MRVLIIYDNSGKIFTQIAGDFIEPVGLQYLVIEIPNGKNITRVDTSVIPHVPIFEELPKTEKELLQEQIDGLTIALAEMMGV